MAKDRTGDKEMNEMTPEQQDYELGDLQPGFNEYLLPIEVIKTIDRETNKRMQDLANTTEGRFRQEEMHAIIEDGEIRKLKAQLEKAYPLIRRDVLRDVGEDMCVLCGNLMLEDKENGNRVLEALAPLLKKYHLIVYPISNKES